MHSVYNTSVGYSACWNFYKQAMCRASFAVILPSNRVRLNVVLGDSFIFSIPVAGCLL